MKQLDFLPARFREEHAQRQKQFWRIVVVSIFVALLSLAACGLYQRRRAVQRELVNARSRYEAVTARQAQLQALTAEVKGLEDKADLLVYLRHPWPKSQVLATALAPLPDSLTLDSIHVKRERLPTAAGAFARGGPPPTGAKPGGDQLSGAEQDLRRLQGELSAAETIVALEGTTHDTLALHAYLAGLASSDLFAKAELVAIESAAGEPANVFHFRVRLVTRPGPGQAEGPLLHPAMAATPR